MPTRSVAVITTAAPRSIAPAGAMSSAITSAGNATVPASRSRMSLSLPSSRLRQPKPKRLPATPPAARLSSASTPPSQPPAATTTPRAAFAPPHQPLIASPDADTLESLSHILEERLTMPGRRCYQRERNAHATIAPEQQRALHALLIAQLPAFDRALIGQ